MATNVEAAYRHLEQVYERMIAPLGLNILEWYALRALYEEDGLTASRMAALVCRHPSSMTALLDRMEDKDLLRRQIDPNDRRSVRVFLTDQGRAYQPRVEQVVQQLGTVMDTLVTREQMDAFFHVLSVLQNVPLPNGA